MVRPCSGVSTTNMDNGGTGGGTGTSGYCAAFDKFSDTTPACSGVLPAGPHAARPAPAATTADSLIKSRRDTLCFLDGFLLWELAVMDNPFDLIYCY